MKTTKVVEIEICDTCGREVHHPRACTGCGKEICSSCTSSFTVRVIESSKYKYTPTRYGDQASCTVREPINMWATYCPACSDKIGDTLRAAGFQIEKEQEKYEI